MLVHVSCVWLGREPCYFPVNSVAEGVTARTLHFVFEFSTQHII